MGIYLEYGASETTKASQRSKVMDNTTCDGLNRSPRKSNEPYTTYETQRKTALEQHYSKGVTNNYNKALLAAIMVMMVTLLLITIVSLALSVAAYNRSKPEQTTVQNQQSESEPENDTIVAQTQLDTTCNNLSQVLFRVLDTYIND